MKKYTALIIVLCTVFSLTGCGGSPDRPASDQTQASVPGETQSGGTPTDPSEKENSGAIEVDKGLLDVTITLPASFFEGMTDFDPDAYTKEQGFQKTIVNDDHSVSITMSKSKHKELMAEMKASVEKSFSELIEGKDTPYIKTIDSDDGYHSVHVKVDKAAYESAFDLTPFMIGLSAMMYQHYDGSELHCEVIIADADTGDTLSSVVYPDDLK